MARPTKITPAVVARLQALRGEGHSIRSIADQLSISRSTVHRITELLSRPHVQLSAPVVCMACRQTTDRTPCQHCLASPFSSRRVSPFRNTTLTRRQRDEARYEEIRRARTWLD